VWWRFKNRILVLCFSLTIRSGGLMSLVSSAFAVVPDSRVGQLRSFELHAQDSRISVLFFWDALCPQIGTGKKGIFLRSSKLQFGCGKAKASKPFSEFVEQRAHNTGTCMRCPLDSATEPKCSTIHALCCPLPPHGAGAVQQTRSLCDPPTFPAPSQPKSGSNTCRPQAWLPAPPPPPSRTHVRPSTANVQRSRAHTLPIAPAHRPSFARASLSKSYPSFHLTSPRAQPPTSLRLLALFPIANRHSQPAFSGALACTADKQMQPDSTAPPQGKSIMHLLRPAASSKAPAPRIQYTLQQIRTIGADPALKVPPPSSTAAPPLHPFFSRRPSASAPWVAQG
jgi:hypothetical protein